MLANERMSLAASDYDCASKAEALGLIPGQGTKIPMLPGATLKQKTVMAAENMLEQ